MPKYEYECLKCGKQFEIEQRISDPAIKECPNCRGKVKRLISAGGGFIMKGADSGAGHHPSPGSSDCSFSETGKTCCGRDVKCEKPPCGS